jgi:hypothetical protein
VKKVFFVLILQCVGIKTYAQSILLEPKSSTKPILEINSGANNTTGVRLNQLANVLEFYEEYNVPSAVGVAFNGGNNTLYVNSFSENKIKKIDGFSNVNDFISSGLNGPHDIILGTGGYLYVSNFYAGNVLKISTSGTSVVYATGFSNPTGLTFDNNGNLYVANYGNGTISKVAVGGAVTHNFITGLSDPYGVVYDSFTNKIFISNYSANEIAQADATTGGAKTTFKAGITACTGISRNSHGDLIVAQASPNKIILISPNGQVKDLITTTYPLDVAIDDADNLYVANQTLNKLTKYQPKHEMNSLLAIDIYGNLKKANLITNANGLSLNSSISGYSPTAAGTLGSPTVGVWGSSGNHVGVYGYSYTDIGVSGASSSGTGIRGYSTTGYAGYFIGNVIVTGTFSNPSDFTLKRNITPLRSSLQKICSIGCYNYYWKDSAQNKGLQTGVIAQELQNILPELVIEDKDKKLSVNYIGLIPHLIEAVKELKNENEDLKSNYEQIKKQNSEILKELKQLMAYNQSLVGQLESKKQIDK